MSMTNEQTPIKIIIPDEEEVPFVPEQPRSRTKERLRNAGGRTTSAAKQMPGKIWRSRARRKITGGMKRGVVFVTAKSNQVVRDTVVRRAKQRSREKVAAARTSIQTRDWKRDVKMGTANGLRWVSRNLAALAERFNSKQNG